MGGVRRICVLFGETGKGVHIVTRKAAVAGLTLSSDWALATVTPNVTLPQSPSHFFGVLGPETRVSPLSCAQAFLLFYFESGSC